MIDKMGAKIFLPDFSDEISNAVLVEETQSFDVYSPFFNACGLSANKHLIQFLSKNTLNPKKVLVSLCYFHASHNNVFLQDIALAKNIDNALYESYYIELKDYFLDKGFHLEKGLFPHFYLDKSPFNLDKDNVFAKKGKSIFSDFSDKVWHQLFCETQMLLSQTPPFNGLWLWQAKDENAKVSNDKNYPIYTDNSDLAEYLIHHKKQAFDLDAAKYHKKTPALFWLEKSSSLYAIIDFYQNKINLDVYTPQGIWKIKKKTLLSNLLSKAKFKRYS